MGRKPVYVPEQILLFDNNLLIAPTSNQALEVEADKETPGSDSRKIPNEYGSYSLEDCEVLPIQIAAKKIKAELAIRVVQCSDGLWRTSLTYMFSESGSCGPVFHSSQGFNSRYGAIQAAASELRTKVDAQGKLAVASKRKIRDAIAVLAGSISPDIPAAVLREYTSEQIAERNGTCPDWFECDFRDDCFSGEKNPECDCLKNVAGYIFNCSECDYRGPDHMQLVKHLRAAHNYSLKDSMKAASEITAKTAGRQPGI